MPESGGADLSPDGQRVVYSPLARDFRPWKRYQGGWAQELYLFDLSTYELERVTEHPRADRDPMWLGETVVFNSDRTGTFNLYAFDLASRETRPLTEHELWDVRWPSSDQQGRVVYELNGELRVLDTASGADRPLTIQVPDDGLARRPHQLAVGDQIENFGLSPHGERAVFAARGDIFTVPAEKGPSRNLTQSSGAHDRWPAWSPDGREIAFFSDRDGEDELYLIPQDGSGEPRQLTDGGSAMRFAPRWSPDGKRIAFSDKNGKLFVVAVGDGTANQGNLVEIADSLGDNQPDYSWSPDSAYLTFTLPHASGVRSVYIWSASGGEVRQITSESFNDASPAWSPDGQYLYYLSDRALAPQLDLLEWNFQVNRQSEIFALALRADGSHPFPPKSDEVKLDGEEDEESEADKSAEADSKKKETKGDEESKVEAVRIDFDGLADRVARVPVEGGNYYGLQVVEGKLLFLDRDAFYYGRSSDHQPILKAFDLEKQEISTLAEGITRGYTLSEDGQKLLVNKGAGYELLPIGGGESKPISTAGLEVYRDPQAEWAQIFDEVWRRYRDYFYVENMHGYDWQAIGDRYRALLPYVGHRSDLNYLMGEMIAELNVGHAYVAGGDIDIPDRPQVALPGAELELDQDADRYRIASILQGDNHEERYRSPLTEVGVEVREGDYLLAIDGQEVKAQDNPYRMLRFKARSPVTWTVASSPDGKDRREITYRPITSESALRYHRWVASRRAMVEELGSGRLGYLHIPDMGADGIREFIKWYYPQIRREGLVVDVRNNGGGNVSQMIIERLSRELLGLGYSRNSEIVSTYPITVFHGPMACILDEDSSSDGDIFPWMFRQAGLGPLIGKRSWGGVIGITNRGNLIDGGEVYVPEFGLLSPEGEWIIEGHGVDPDIEVTNDPRSVIEGRDPQLERAVQEVLGQIESEGWEALPKQPEPPIKTEGSTP
jgi:tricorn protease